MKRFLDDVDESKLFSNLYNESSIVGKMFFTFAKPLLNQILKNEKFDDNQLLSIHGNNASSSQIEATQFMLTYAELRDIRKKEQKWAVIYAIYSLYKRNLLMCLFTAIFAEILCIYCCYNIGYLTEFMVSPEKTSHY
jgi:hypothetical protein